MRESFPESDIPEICTFCEKHKSTGQQNTRQEDFYLCSFDVKLIVMFRHKWVA